MCRVLAENHKNKSFSNEHLNQFGYKKSEILLAVACYIAVSDNLNDIFEVQSLKLKKKQILFFVYYVFKRSFHLIYPLKDISSNRFKK